MNCLTAQRLMHLTGAGERSGDERAALERHLSGCAACRAEAAAIPRADRLLREHFLPAPDPPADPRLTNDILLGIAAVESADDGPVGTLLRLFSRTPVRYAAAAALVLLLGGFLLHFIQLRADVALLEQRMSLRSDAAPGIEVVYAVRSHDVAAAAGVTAPPTDASVASFAANGHFAFTRSELADLFERLSRTSTGVRLGPSAAAVDIAEIPAILGQLGSRLFLTMRIDDQGV